MPLLDEIPEWARILEASDPTSLQPNREEATETKKDTGFNFREFVTRQDLNYLQNLNGRWIKSFRNINGTLIHGFEHTGIFDEGGSSFSISFKKGVATSSNKEMFFDANVDAGWPGALLKKFITGGNFSEGDGNPGLASGLTLTEFLWYHSFVIRLPNGKIDVGFDTSIVAANLIAGDSVTHWRRISSFFWQTIGSGPLFGKDFIQNGDYFIPKTKIPGTGSFHELNVGIQSETLNQILIPDGFRTKISWQYHIQNIGDTAVSYIQVVGDEQITAPSPFQKTRDIVIGQNESSPIFTFHDGIANETTVISNVEPNGQLQILTSIIYYIDERGRNDF